MKYYDVDLCVSSREADFYHLAASSESLQKKEGKLLVADLDKARTSLAAFKDGGESGPKEAGALLFAALFAAPIGNLYQQTLGQAYADDNAGVRIRLKIDEPEIAALPWELVFDPDRNSFLANSSETLLTRYVDLKRPIKDLSTALPFKILVVAPENAGPGVSDEKRTIEEALCSLGAQAVEVTVLEGKVTSQMIIRELTLKQFHLFHFVGRSAMVGNEPCVFLHSKEGAGDETITAEQFSDCFQGYPCLKLIVLRSAGNAQDVPEAMNPLAQFLVKAGLPAAVALGSSLTLPATAVFLEAFYLRLLLGYESGRVDIATAHARKRVASQFPLTNEFAGAVLFTRSPKGVIFDLGQQATISTLNELHTLNAVTHTRQYNIRQLEKTGGADAEAGIAKEIAAQSKLRARASQFYRRVALLAAPRVVLITLLLAVLLFAASFTRFFDVLKVDDYVTGMLHLWSDVPDKSLNPNVRMIIAKEGDDLGRGTPKSNPEWRRYHVHLLEGFAQLNKRPKEIVFDIRLSVPGPDDQGFADAIRRAQQQSIKVIGGQELDENGLPIMGGQFNPVLSPAFGDRWGNVHVGGQLKLPLLRTEQYVNKYEVASIAPNAQVGRVTPVQPSLALQAVIQHLADSAGVPTAYFDDLQREVVIKSVQGIILRSIPVSVEANHSLYMLLDYARSDTLLNNTTDYKNAHDWAMSTRSQDKDQLERLFANTVVLVGYDTDADSQYVIGDGKRSGVSIHANAISNILTNVYVRQLSSGANFLIILIMIVTGILLQTILRRFLRKKIKLILPVVDKFLGDDITVPAGLLAVIVAYLVVAYVIYSRSRISFDMSYHLAALLFGYWMVAIFRNKLRLTEAAKE